MTSITKFILVQLLLCAGLLWLLKPRNRRQRTNPCHPARRFNDRVENRVVLEEPVDPLTHHVRNISDEQLSKALKSTRHSESYGKSQGGQRLLQALKEEDARRRARDITPAPGQQEVGSEIETPPGGNLCRSCARAGTDCNIGSPGTAYCNEYRQTPAA